LQPKLGPACSRRPTSLGFAPYVKCLKVAELDDIITSTAFEIIENGFYPASPPSRFIVARK